MSYRFRGSLPQLYRDISSSGDVCYICRVVKCIDYILHILYRMFHLTDKCAGDLQCGCECTRNIPVAEIWP